MCAPPPSTISSFSWRQERSIFASSNQQAGLHILAFYPPAFVVPSSLLHPTSSIFIFFLLTHHHHPFLVHRQHCSETPRTLPLHPHSLKFILSFHSDLCWLCSIPDTLLSPPTPHHTSSPTHSHNVQRSYHRGSDALPSGLEPGQPCTCASPSQHVPTLTACPQFPHPSP